jgi:histidinol-phosphatase (PHP family)
MIKTIENYKQNLHTHTTFCDGKNSAEDVVKKAIEKGFDSIGFSAHAPMSYSEYFNKANMQEYIDEIFALKNKYKGQFDIYCGLEFDAYCGLDISPYEYTIGSLHYLKVDGRYIPFDRSSEYVVDMIKREFNGKGIDFAKRYYEELANLREFGKFDIIGHFDLITKNLTNHHAFLCKKLLQFYLQC